MERKYKLMLVDDEPWALTGIEEIIDWEALGFSVVARCGCGREALLQARIHQPDAVITDIRMPDMTGIELIRLIRQVPLPVGCIVVRGDAVKLERMASTLIENACKYANAGGFVSV